MSLADLVESINDYLGIVLIFLLCGTGIFLTIKLRFIQVTKFGEAFKSVFGNIKFGAEAGAEGMSSFQSLATAIAAQVGTGNIAGSATAIVSGGPGAIFWMWLSGFFGMATIFAEASLAQEYKTTVDGQVTGGPSYYIKAAFTGKFGKVLAGIFSLLVIFALGFMGNMVQSNTLGSAFESAFGIKALYVGIFVAIVAFIVFRGGVKRIASVVELVVPFMALIYVIIAVIAIIIQRDALPMAVKSIVVGAFSPQAVVGGAVGISVRQAIRYGVARGLFSNEAGMGSTPHAHAVAKVDHPCDQGLVAIVGLFIDTFVVLTLNALVILTSGAVATGATSIALAQEAFMVSFGTYGSSIIAICLFFFAFSTIIGWYFFGEQNIRYLFGKKAVSVYALIVCGFIILGSVMKVDLVWALADLFNSLMVIPNLIAMIALTGVTVRLYNEFMAKKKKA